MQKTAYSIRYEHASGSLHMDVLGVPPDQCSAAPVLFLHGTDRHAGFWSSFWTSSDPRRSYLALDLPEHGRSTASCPSTVEEHTKLVWEMVDDLSLGNPVVVGHSFGGAIAQEMALSRPDRVTGLVLTATGAKLRVHPQIIEFARLAAEADDPPRVDLRIAYAPGIDPDTYARIEELTASPNAAANYRCWLACDGFDRRTSMSSVRAPTLVVCGDHDFLTPLKYHTYLADHIQGARLQVIPGGGHMLPTEVPTAFYAALEEFLCSSADPRTPPRDG